MHDKATVTIRFHVTPEQAQALADICRDLGVSQASFIRDAIWYTASFGKFQNIETKKDFPRTEIKTGRRKLAK